VKKDEIVKLSHMMVAVMVMPDDGDDDDDDDDADVSCLFHRQKMDRGRDLLQVP
jgi:hypothetical protein